VLESSIAESRPWLRWYGTVPPNLTYPDVTLYQALKATAQRVPSAVAWDFFDTTSTYSELVESIDTCANALAGLGLKRDERILIAMPTAPQGIIAFYAANKLGAIPAMVHPLSTAPEMEHYLNISGARIALALDAFYDRFASIKPRVPLETLIIARIPDFPPRLKSFAYWFIKGRKNPRVPDDPRVRWWSALMGDRHAAVEPAQTTTNDPAAILFSGGTTGTPKGIVLSNRNFIAEGTQALTWGGMGTGHSILAILPIFHGFGLGVCVNACFMAGATSILVPLFSADLVAKLLRKKRPNVIVGVPTLYAALARHPSLAKTDLSSLRATFSGADTLPRPVKEEFEQLVLRRGGNVKLMEGYGLTEAVTAIMAMPLDSYREGSVGVPFPDMLAKICKVGTEEELPPGEEGEICVSGPAVMIGYLDEPEATRETLRTHADGSVWLHTGDMGKMDADGFFYFVERLKRMIKSSGFNVFPGQVEAVLYKHPLVLHTCVVGVPDPSQVERVKAFVVLKDQSLAGPATERSLIEHCQSQLIKWSCPREIEFREELPKTQIGKNDYKAFVRDHIANSSNRDRK
jgi:long-chain acyl-CoA synthetase